MNPRLDARTTGLLAIVLLACATITFAGCGAAAGPVSGTNTSGPGEPAIAPPPVPLPLAGKVMAPASGAYLGVYSPPAPFDVPHIDAFESKVGKSVSIVMWYQPWESKNRSRFDTATVVAVMRRGKVPLITWEPWNPGNNANDIRNPGTQRPYRLSRINAGAFDEYIRGWAREIRALGGPVMLRPMHEMNGSWYPWSGTANGNKPAEFVKSWRRIHDIFAEEGATNVTWVWSINHESVPSSKRNSYATYYPGDAYVDWTAISGFNFGTTSSYSSFRPFMHWYTKPLAYLKTLKKPIVVAEFSSVEQGGSKAAWIIDAYTRIRKMPQIKAVVYYDSLEKGAYARQDWRVDTSKASLRAFRNAVAPSYFLGSAPPELTSWADSLDAGQWKALTSIDPLY
ncbi:MAG: glycosyl hydrolase [Coriobacteriia bacterium]|nr:glycosyl hydrolase [Coriobacteriia bacterium]